MPGWGWGRKGFSVGMRTEQIFSALQDAQRTEGYAWIEIVFKASDSDIPIVISSKFRQTALEDEITASLQQGATPIGIVGIPTCSARSNGLPSLIRQFVPDDWAHGYLEERIDQGNEVVDLNPHIYR